MPAARRVTVSNVAKTGVAQPFAKANDEAAKAAAGEDGRPSRAEAEAAVRVLLRWAGDDPDREGLVGQTAEARRGAPEFVGTCRSLWALDHLNRKTTPKNRQTQLN